MWGDACGNRRTCEEMWKGGLPSSINSYIIWNIESIEHRLTQARHCLVFQTTSIL